MDFYTFVSKRTIHCSLFSSKNIRKIQLLTVLISILALQVTAKNDASKSYLYPSRVIEGTVTDNSGEPLSGVTVRIKDSNVGTVTDAEGKFSIEVPGDDAILQFSFLGFQTQEITVSSSSELNIKLQTSATNLEQLVVVEIGR